MSDYSNTIVHLFRKFRAPFSGKHSKIKFAIGRQMRIIAVTVLAMELLPFYYFHHKLYNYHQNFMRRIIVPAYRSFTAEQIWHLLPIVYLNGKRQIIPWLANKRL